MDNGESRSCFELEILRDKETECNEALGLIAEVALGTDRRRFNITGRDTQVIINETCTCVSGYVIIYNACSTVSPSS